MKNVSKGLLFLGVVVSSSSFAQSLQLQLTGSITDSACEPSFTIDGATSHTNTLDLGTYTIAELSNQGTLASSKKTFTIAPKNASDCSVTKVDITVTGQSAPGYARILANQNANISNVGFEILDESSTPVLNQPPQSMAYEDSGVDYTVSLYNVNGNAPEAGALMGVANFSVTYY